MIRTARVLEFLYREGPVVFFITGPTAPWPLISISHNVEKQLGVKAEDAMKNPNFFWDHVHPEDRAEGQIRAETLEHAGRMAHVCRMLRADGSYSWVKGEFLLNRDENGIPIEVVGFLTDETEMNRAKAILGAIPDSVLEVTGDGLITFCKVQPGSDAAVGKNLFDILPEGPRTISKNAIARAMRDGLPQSVKFALPGAEGACRHFQLNIGPTSERRSVVVVAREITEEVLQEKVLSEQKRFLEEANTSLEQFVYVASHDLREPLTGVAGYATLLQKKHSAGLDEQGKRWLQGIVEGMQRLSDKIDDLLALSRVNRGNATNSFSMATAIESAKKSVIGPTPVCPITFKMPDNLPMIRGDRGQITQIFQNLFSNSIKYRQKDVPLVIEVAVQDDPQNPAMFQVSLQDNGIGFDPKHVERVFGVFQRLHTIQQYPGTGIGLAIVKKIVERHGGRVWAMSQVNQGATFTFTIPKA